MTTLRVFILLLATLALSSAFILPAKDQALDSHELENNPLVALVDMMFGNADTNQDGTLDMDEFWQTFNAFDGNGDARITLSEYVDFFGKIPVLSGIPNMSRTAAVLFHEGDMDGDQHLSRNDAYIIFNNLDTDHDDRVSKKEYFERWKMVMARIGRASRAQGHAK